MANVFGGGGFRTIKNSPINGDEKDPTKKFSIGGGEQGRPSPNKHEVRSPIPLHVDHNLQRNRDFYDTPHRDRNSFESPNPTKTFEQSRTTPSRITPRTGP